MDKPMDKVIRARIPSDLKDKFEEICKEKAINPSQWIRLQIEKFVNENRRN